MRDHDGKLTFAPRLPARLTRLAFRLLFRGRKLEVRVTKHDATYRLLDGRPLVAMPRARTSATGWRVPTSWLSHWQWTMAVVPV